MSGDFQTVLKSLNSNIAREIEELLLMKQDLDRAIKCVEAWADIFDKNDNSDRHEVITSSLFRNCIITFMACFDTADCAPQRPDATGGCRRHHKAGHGRH